jgi:hydrogenase maturation factor
MFLMHLAVPVVILAVDATQAEKLVLTGGRSFRLHLVHSTHQISQWIK